MWETKEGYPSQGDSDQRVTSHPISVLSNTPDGCTSVHVYLIYYLLSFYYVETSHTWRSKRQVEHATQAWFFVPRLLAFMYCNVRRQLRVCARREATLQQHSSQRSPCFALTAPLSSNHLPQIVLGEESGRMCTQVSAGALLFSFSVCVAAWSTLLSIIR